MWIIRLSEHEGSGDLWFSTSWHKQNPRRCPGLALPIPSTQRAKTIPGREHDSSPLQLPSRTVGVSWASLLKLHTSTHTHTHTQTRLQAHSQSYLTQILLEHEKLNRNNLTPFSLSPISSMPAKRQLTLCSETAQPCYTNKAALIGVVQQGLSVCIF